MDLETIQRYALNVWQAKQGEMVSLMIQLGDRLGLFRAMAGRGFMTPAELGKETELHARPLREWLYGLAAADVLSHDDGRFELPPEGVPVLVDEATSLFFAAGAFGATFPSELIDTVIGLFETGRGADYDSLGDDMAMIVERLTGPFNRLALVPMVLPQLSVGTTRLGEGGRVADVGCGTGMASEAVARAFPGATVTALDPSVRALDRGRARAGEIPNLVFTQGRAEDLSGGPFDLIMALDCLHDMPRPDTALAAMRREVADDGVLLIKELRSSGDFERDRRNPLLAMSYGFSLIGCLLSGMSTDDGWALGNTGLHQDALTALVADHGFRELRRLDVPDPGNTYYEVRP
ncbi:MAG: class I SAM-dependent methyltransferase [Acidimicrobiia bacterium]|nr:class I SAM-dependent methyltransferase [Acidimicrobiia bacterium]